VRIISGIYKGRIVNTPKGHRTHPMSERMRGALFNSLGDISGLTVLDAYAGSGAVGIEALSRGASFVLFVDQDKNAINSINSNVNNLNIINSKVTKANIASWSDHNFETQFDIVIADPPYDLINDNHLLKLTRNVRPEGIFVLSLPRKYKEFIHKDFEKKLHKSYADGSIAVYLKQSRQKP
jgi:16S rRNA (guanine(966)-N(2))-methyltransferase RsmD